MNKVGIVILNWNRPIDTKETVESVLKCSVSNNFKYQIYIVDNASSDNSVKLLRDSYKSRPNVELLLNTSNKGYAGGNNSGIKKAMSDKCEFVLILNNDIRIEKDMIVNLLSAAQKYPDGGMFSPKIYFEKGYEYHKKRYKTQDIGKVIWYTGGSIDWDNVYGSNRGVDEVDKGQYDSVWEEDFATGACVLIRSEVLDKTGLFDERYFMYFEDGDLSIKAKRLGWKLYYVPTALLWHKVAQSSGIGSELNDYFIHRNRMLFGMTYAPLRTKINLMDESFRFILRGRPWQKKGIIDYYLGKYGKGSWK